MVRHRFGALLGVVLAATSACAFGPQYADRNSEPVPVVLHVSDERGNPIEDARITVDGRTGSTDVNGEFELLINQPIVAVVSSADALDEPVAIGPTDGRVEIRLWDRLGENREERTSMHFGGDMMLGRRYLETDRTDTPIVTDEASARAVVGSLAPLSAAADWTVANLESVIGEHPDDDAYAAKRFLLQSTPHVTAALDEMGVDLVTLGNNHAYDWLDPGLVTTLDALDAAGIAHTGAALSREEAIKGQVVDVGGTRAGIISFTTVNGSFVNDQLPGPREVVPADLVPSEAWQYERRPFTFGEPDDVIYVPPSQRRIGEVWELFVELEELVGEDNANELWHATIAVFPELQDWVARRGHGGAAPYRRSDMEAEILRLQRAGAEWIVVQIHGGFQFADVESEFMRRISHAAVDAGADAVISHHPHVLQGVEWYRNKLIAYSLGNLLFDQDFLATFPSAMLRLVVEGDEILEARFLPVVLDRYRPEPVVGGTAAQIVRLIDARSANDATAERVAELEVGTVIEASSALGTTETSVVFERNSGLVRAGRLDDDVSVVFDGGRRELLPVCALVRTDRLAPGVEIGTDLFDFGSFEDDTADGERGAPFAWGLPTDDTQWAIGAGATGEPFDDSLVLFTDTDAKVSARFLSRVEVPLHRLHDERGAPVDARPRYEVLLDAKRTRGEQPILRVTTFAFDDTDPTANPETTVLATARIPIDLPDDGRWHRVSVPLPARLFAADRSGVLPNTASLHIDAPPALRGELTLDNVRLLEWRERADTPYDYWVEGDAVRAASSAEAALTVSGC